MARPAGASELQHPNQPTRFRFHPLLSPRLPPSAYNPTRVSPFCLRTTSPTLVPSQSPREQAESILFRGKMVRPLLSHQQHDKRQTEQTNGAGPGAHCVCQSLGLEQHLPFPGQGRTATAPPPVARRNARRVETRSRKNLRNRSRISQAGRPTSPDPNCHWWDPQSHKPAGQELLSGTVRVSPPPAYQQ